jgi:hypothetical protein
MFVVGESMSKGEDSRERKEIWDKKLACAREALKTTNINWRQTRWWSAA